MIINQHSTSNIEHRTSIQREDLIGRWVLSVGCWFFSIWLTLAAAFAQDKPAAIPGAQIKELRIELADGLNGANSVEVRRACKSVIRKAQGLVDSAAEAPNRWELLGVVFEAQKRLLGLEFTEDNRGAIFEISGKLIEAPDEYAELRLEADMLLMEKNMSEAGAKVDERIAALKTMLARYRGTAAEWQSLVMGSMIAAKLLDFDCEQKIQDTMLERFAGDHKVIQFRRHKQNGGEIDAVFSGTHKTVSGTSLTFPYDLMGHQYVAYFWSKDMPELEKQVAAVKAVQDAHPGQFTVFSFNVDELPDAGEKVLRKMKVDWIPIHLPLGRKSSAYIAYAQRDPNAVFVNGQGHVLLVSPPAWLGNADVQGVNQGVLGGWNLPSLAGKLDDERYLAQLRYLFIGDFLVAQGMQPVTPSSEDLVPKEALQEIQACFTDPPFRYRLKQKESLANYQKAEKLSATAIRKYDKAKDVYVLQNYRIIALIGMWNLALKPEYLEEAAKESKALLASNPAPGADVVARFCLARKALRDGDDPERAIAQMVEANAGDKASVLAAAAILALEGNSRTVHNKYRDQLLAIEDIKPGLWAVRSFLMDLHHRYRNFWASPGGFGFGRPQKYEFRNTVSGLGDPMDRGKVEFTLKRPGGGVMQVPGVASGEMLGVLFVEPPSDASLRSNLVERVNSMTKAFAAQGVDTVVAFLSDDMDAVGALATNSDAEIQVDMFEGGRSDPIFEALAHGNGEFHAGMLEGGLSNPLVVRLGILSADRIPNLMLYGPDGAVAWVLSGLEYRQFGGRTTDYALMCGILRNIEKVRMDPCFEAVEQGDFKKALSLFEEISSVVNRGTWAAADRLQGEALAYMGLKDWQSALTRIDAAIDRRIDDFKGGICKCHGLVEMYLTKAMILDKLGRGREARMERARAAAEKLPHAELPPGVARSGVPIGVYYDWLKRIRLGLEGGAAPGNQ